MKRLLVLVASLLVPLLAAGPAWSQGAYPTKPIRIVVPFGAGGTSDSQIKPTHLSRDPDFGDQFDIVESDQVAVEGGRPNQQQWTIRH